MAASTGGGQQSRVISGINMTPLVDVLLVLLVIFMITNKVVTTRQLPVELPKVAAGAVESQQQVELIIEAAGEAQCGGKPVTLQTFRDCLSSAPDKTHVIIAADRRTPHGAVVQWLQALQQAEYRQISFATVDP